MLNEVKCCNYGGNHPASYKGCEIHKQLQQKLFPKLKEKTEIVPKLRSDSRTDLHNGNEIRSTQTSTSYA